jgi:hypothetical protein
LRLLCQLQPLLRALCLHLPLLVQHVRCLLETLGLPGLHGLARRRALGLPIGRRAWRIRLASLENLPADGCEAGEYDGDGIL